MARRSTPCTQADITRLIKGALAAGLSKDHLARVRLTRDGVELLLGNGNQAHTGSANDNESEWDEVLSP